MQRSLRLCNGTQNRIGIKIEMKLVMEMGKSVLGKQKRRVRKHKSIHHQFNVLFSFFFLFFNRIDNSWSCCLQNECQVNLEHFSIFRNLQFFFSSSSLDYAAINVIRENQAGNVQQQQHQQ